MTTGITDGIETVIHHSEGPVKRAATVGPAAATVGRVVHYQSYGTPGGEYLPEPRAAIITALPPTPDHSGFSLAILNPTGMFFNTGVPFAEKPTPGSWNWPPRV